MRIIDLHGFTEEEAIGPIQTALMDIIYGTIDEINIITGNGEVLRDLVFELANAEGLFCNNEGNNSGSLIITK